MRWPAGRCHIASSQNAAPASPHPWNSAQIHRQPRRTSHHATWHPAHAIPAQGLWDHPLHGGVTGTPAPSAAGTWAHCPNHHAANHSCSVRLVWHFWMVSGVKLPSGAWPVFCCRSASRMRCPEWMTSSRWFCQ